MYKEWAHRNSIPMRPLAHPFTFSFFNGMHDVITHLAYPKAVRIGPHNHPWTFFVVASSPMPVVLGLDAIHGWPLFYSPLDDRLFIVDDLGTRRDSKREVLAREDNTKTVPTSSSDIASTPPIAAAATSSPALSAPLQLSPSPFPFPQQRQSPCSSVPPLFWDPPNSKISYSATVNSGESGRETPVTFQQLPDAPPEEDLYDSVDMVVEDVVDFMRVSLSPWSVE